MDIAIAAFLSALATAVGSYIVQKRLEKKRSHETLKRIATSVYIHVIPILVIARVSQKLVDIFVDEDIRKRCNIYLQRPGVDRRYFWISLIHEIITRKLRENPSNLKLKDIMRVQKMLDTWGDRKTFHGLRKDTISQLPGHVMACAFRYEEFYIGARILISDYFDQLIAEETKEINVSATYQVWQHIELLYESATELSEALIKWCPLSLEEIHHAEAGYEKMAWIQIEGSFDLQEKMRPSIVAALEVIDKGGNLNE